MHAQYARWRYLLGASLALAAVGWLDWATGIELRVYSLYFFPVALGGWANGRRAAWALSVVATAVWVFTNGLAGMTYSHPWIWVANAITQLFGLTAVGLLIAELRRRFDREAALSRTDSLTGLANLRAFQDRVELVLGLARRGKRSTALVYVDLDHFKAVNDTQGHAAGDQVLRATAQCLRAAVRSTDLPARLGGDEFALLLPETDAEAARVVIERFRAGLAEAMRLGGWPVTASIGALVFPQPPADLAAALAGADALMYRAKQAGRDRSAIEVVSA